jgi:hypothetical protein
MSCNNLVASQFNRSSFQSLPPEHPTVRAVVLTPNHRHNFVHRPPIQVLIPQYHQRQVLSLLVTLHRLQRIVSIPLDTFVNGQHIKVNPVLIPFVQLVEQVRDNSRILATACTNRYFITLLEQIALDDRLVHFILELSEETILTDCPEVTRPFDQGFVRVATLA